MYQRAATTPKSCTRCNQVQYRAEQENGNITTKDITDDTVNRRSECHGELYECRCKAIDNPK